MIPVLHLVNGFIDASIGRIIQRLILHLGQARYSWHVGALSGQGDLQEQYRSVGAQVVDFSAGTGSSGATLQRLSSYIADQRIRMVHTHTPRAVLAAARALAATPRVIHLATKHLLYAPGDRRWGLAYALLDRLSLYLPHHLIAVSGKMYRQILAMPGVGGQRVTMIRNAIDCDSYYVPDQGAACRQQLGLGIEAIVIGYTGRLSRAKRLDLLLEAFSQVLARHPEARLIIVGDGELGLQLEALASHLGVAHAVIWTGFRRDIPQLLAAMDIFVQSSDNEGLSLSLLEAMAAGKPVIATDVGGTSEVVDSETGVLIPPGSSDAIASALLDLLDRPDKRASLLTAGKRRVDREFGVQRMMKAYRGLYERLVPG